MSLDETVRLERERSFHNLRYGSEPRVAQLKFYAAISHGSAKFETLVLSQAIGKDVLDYGCGEAKLSLLAAPTARSIVGIDISDVAAALANEKASALGISNSRYAAMNAECLDLPDASFDLVFGSGIIHHLDLGKAYGEIARVLRPGGQAIFWEPLGHNPVINLYRFATPGARTPDEHPLLMADIRLAEDHFGEVSFEPFGLATLASVPLRSTALFPIAHRAAKQVDRLIFQVPGVSRFAWFALMTMRAGPRPEN